MEVTVEEFLQIPILRGCNIIAGGKGLNRVITSLGMLDGYAGYVYIASNMLAISSGYFLTTDNLAHRGNAGLTLKAKYFNYHIPPDIVKTADELNFPVILLPDNDMPFYQIFEYFYMHVYIRSAKTFIRLEDISVVLSNMIHTYGLKGLAEQLYSLTKKPVIIILQKNNYNYLKKNQKSSLNQELSESASIDDSIIKLDKKGLMLYHSEEASGFGICFKYKHQDDGMIWLDESECSCDDNDAVLLNAAKVVCEISNTQLLAYEEDESRLKFAFIEKLLSGELNSMNEAVLETNKLRWRIPKEASVLIIECQDDQYLYQKLEEFLNELYKERKLRIISCIYNQSLLSFIPGDIEDIDGKITGIYNELHRKYPSNRIFFSLGRKVDFLKARISYQQALLAMRLQPILKKDDYIVKYSEIGLYRFCSTDALSDEVCAYCREIMTPLLEHNKASGVDLIETLKVYFESQFNFTIAGQKLFVHPNTVRYRLTMVESICNMHFDNFYDVLNLQNAIALMPVVYPEYESSKEQ